MLSEVQGSFEVLVCEDSHDDEVLCLRALKLSGLPLSIHVARNGDEALTSLGLKSESESEVHVPNLVISDLKMPKVSGAEVLARARSDARLAEVPFVILSSSDEPSDVERCMQLGANGYCVKPVEYSAFMECVKSIASRWLVTGDEDVPCAISVGNGT